MTPDPGLEKEGSGKTLCIVGAGLSALILLRGLIQAIAGSVGETGSPLSIMVVDENEQDQFGRGLAYASPREHQYPDRRGSRAELLNSPAARMNLESTIGPDGDFVQWLKQHQSRWQKLLGLTRKSGQEWLDCQTGHDWHASESRGVKRWLLFNRVKLSAGQYATVYFPRCVYGEYIDDLATSVMASAATAGFNIKYVRARASNFSTKDKRLGPYTISLNLTGAEVRKLYCDFFVYNGGDLQASPLGGQVTNSGKVVENPYSNKPHRHNRIDAIKQILGKPQAEIFTLALAGCNASAMDQIWGIYNDLEIMAALKQGRMNIVVIAPGSFPHSAIILEPAQSSGQTDPLRWIQKHEQRLIDNIVASNLDPARVSTAEQYFAAVKRSLEQLKLDQNPHLFMTFLRQLGEVEQTIKDGLIDIENFARNYHTRIEAMLLFTPYEYWHALAEIRRLNGALEKIDGKVVQVKDLQGTLSVSTDTAKTISCPMLINCTGARNPFDTGPHPEILDDLVDCQLGFNNYTGGLATSLDGRIKLADGSYSSTAYLCTQRAIGLSQPAIGGVPTFIGANRLTAVRVAELAQRVAASLADLVV